MAAPITFGNWQLTIDNILSNTNDQQLKQFSSLKSNEERVTFIVCNGLLRSEEWLPVYFDSCLKWQGKSTEAAQMWRNRGNKLFQQKVLDKALAAYTQSSLSAPRDDSNDYVLSLGNRSAALFHMGKYRECLTDIKRALALGFPPQSRHKILTREVWAHVKLRNAREAGDCIKKLQSFIKSSECDLSQDKKDEVSKEVQTLNKKILSLNNSAPIKEASSPGLPSVFHKENRVIAQATEAITLTVTAEQGRFLVANKPLPKGSTLIVERPFAAVLLPDHYDTHCHHCFKTLPLNPLGCSECSDVRFCNEECLDTAWTSYHEVECPYLDLCHSIGVAHLSLRVALTAALPYLKDFLKDPSAHRDDDIFIKGVTKAGLYDRSYLSVFDLVTHEATTACEDMLQYSLTAALLLFTLTSAGRFDSIDGVKEWKHSLCEPNGSDANVPKEVLQIGGVLLRHILQLVCNAHAITCLESQQPPPPPNTPDSMGDAPSAVTSVSQVRVATAIYPTVSLMNHSCDPTIQASFIGEVLVVRTLKDVKKGEEIYNCYGPHHCRMRTEERQDVLKSQYHFTCLCTACTTEDVSSHRFRAFKCSACSGILRDKVCTECGQVMDPFILDRNKRHASNVDIMFAESLETLNSGNYSDALTKLESCLECRQRVLYREHKDLAIVEDAIAKCYANMGSYSASADHLLTSVQFVASMYGAASVEAAHEGLKLAEVLFNAERFIECLEASSEALAVFESVYSDSHEAVCQTRRLRDQAQMNLQPVMQAT